MVRRITDSLKRAPTPTKCRLTAGFLIVAAAGATPLALMGGYVEGSRWARIGLYLGLVFTMATVLRSETIALGRRLKSIRFLGERWNWFLFSLSAAILVFLMEAISIASYGRFPITPPVLATIWNALVLVFLVSVLFAATNRFKFSIGLIYSVYIFGSIANMIKVQYLQTTIRPLDLYYAGAFEEFFTLFFGKAIVVSLIAVFIAWTALMTILWRRDKYRSRLKSRVVWAAVSIVGVVGVSCCDLTPTSMRILKAVNLHKNLSNSKYCAQRRGFLIEFLTDIPASIPRTPANYTKSQVARAIEEHYRLSTPVASTPALSEGVNVIVYLIESFMDPMDLNVEYTRDPIPAFRAAQRENTSGYAVVPNEYFGSTNTEYEILTGMSCAFLPFGACPYVQYVKRDIPNVFAFLHGHGYQTFTAHGGPQCLYDRVKVYEHMHVGHPIWLLETVEKKSWAPLDIAGRYASDAALVDTVIDISEKNSRYFIYASANSTHSPYDYDAYRDSDLDVCDSMSESARDELKIYVNALQTADRALGKLLNHFQHCPEKTIIVVLGDHWPPFSHAAEIYSEKRLPRESDALAIPKQRKVPLLIWSNFREKEPDIVCSTNLICTTILSRIGIEPTEFFALNNSVRSQFSIVSNGYLRSAHGKPLSWGAAPQPLDHLLQDYKLLQYDLLLGKQYSTQDLKAVFALLLQPRQP